MRLAAVIYDLDGTLIDSLDDMATSVNVTLAALGLAPRTREEIRGFIGEGVERLLERSLGESQQALVSEAVVRYRAHYSVHLLDRTRAYPGIAALIAIAPVKRAVLTNKPGVLSRSILEGLGLARAFAQVIGGDEAPKKPRPDGLLALCARLGVRPEEALMVGDSTVDVATAAAAGVPCCAVTWGLGDEAALRAAKPAYVCHSTGEVAALIGGF